MNAFGSIDLNNFLARMAHVAILVLIRDEFDGF